MWYYYTWFQNTEFLLDDKCALKIYSHKFFKKINLLKHNIYALFGRLKQYFACFDCSIFSYAILLSCGIARPIIQAETGVTASARVIRSGQ